MRASPLPWPVNGKGSLKSCDPADTLGFRDKRAAKDKLAADIAALSDLQDVLSAGAQFGVLVVFQGTDAAGKDSAIKHVMSGLNPQGVSVHSFKQPTDEEVRHDYLWRAAVALPERGRVGIFNRSYYEDVIVVRVHPELLAPEFAKQATKALWTRRFRQINEFERTLVENNIVVLKFYFNLSKREQAKRLLARLKEPSKHWKFSAQDIIQRKRWSKYKSVYEETLNATSTPWAPWYVIPADHKRIAHLAIADVLVRRLRALRLAYPKLPAEMRGTLRAWMRQLRKEA